MNINKINLVYFSPTGTSKTIVKSLGHGFGIEVINEYDLTPPKAISFNNDSNENSLTIIGVPVYGGRVPIDAANRLKQIKTNNSLAVVVVVYGNRAFEDSLLELKDIAVECGFIVIGAGAFIGEHSFSITDIPIAKERPDQDDLLKAKAFAGKLKSRVEGISDTESIKELIIPGNHPYKDHSNRPKISPDTDSMECSLCHTCEDVCPVGAITIKAETVITDEKSCIWCCACVKSCPSDARKFDDPVINKAIDWLSTNFNDRKEPEIFL